MKTIFCMCLVLCLAALAYADGLGALVELGRGQADIQKSYAEETKVFDTVKRAVDNGSIKKGQSKKDIENRYGGPVVSVFDRETARDKWIYKPAKSTFFAGIKVYLYFDKNDMLDEIKVVE